MDLPVGTKYKVYILGGGFGGLYAALELERRLDSDLDVEITLVNRDNFFCSRRCCTRSRRAAWT
jgi:NADH dehydrogenase